MNLKLMTTFTVAATLSLLPALSYAAPQIQNTSAVVQLTHAFDARRATPGEVLQTRLTSTVRLANGTKLRAGSWLTAKVVRDVAQPDNVQLVLRFTEARLKNGTVIPIKATIVNVSTYPGDNYDHDTLLVPDKMSNIKDSIDAIGIMKGVDMHSRVSSQDSGMFVSKTRDDLKLPYGTEFELAMSPRGASMKKTSAKKS